MGGRFLEKSCFAREVRQTEGLQRNLASPRSSEDLLVSGCCPASSQSHEGKSAGKYSNSGDSVEGLIGSSDKQREKS